MGRVVYVTGVPAVGKTTFVERLVDKCFGDVDVISYGELLLEQFDGVGSLSDLRAAASGTVTAEAVRRADAELIRKAGEARGTLLIESHAVTVQEYGLRVVPFTSSDIERLKMSAMLLLYDEPASIFHRLHANPDGRKLMTVNEIDFAQNLQASIVANYSVLFAVPLHCIDVGKPDVALRAASAIMTRC